MRNQPFIVAVTVFAAIVFIATTTTFYQRETTSIEAKYIGRSSTEIDALYHTSHQLSMKMMAATATTLKLIGKLFWPWI
jgi:hypothetical protein